MPEHSRIRVAAVQLAPDLDTQAGTMAKVLDAIAEAAGKGARLVVFPETFVPWYPYFSFVQPPVLTGAEHIRLYEHAVAVPGPATEAVAARARRERARPRVALQRATGVRRRRQPQTPTPQDHADLP
jgi:aliphatic nitrilase